MSFDRRQKQIRYYQDRIHQLQLQNRHLKGSLAYRPHSQEPVRDAIHDLQSRNHRLQRVAEQYQYQLKKDLTTFIKNSNYISDLECMFRQKYTRALNYPPPLRYTYR